MIAAQWGDWGNGIPPGRSFKGRGGQNPRLLQAFGALDRALSRWQREQERKSRQTAKPSIFEDPEIAALWGGK